MCDIAYVLLLERLTAALRNPFGGPVPAAELDAHLLAEPEKVKPIDPEMAELMDALRVSR